jgi:hypothetical protein
MRRCTAGVTARLLRAATNFKFANALISRSCVCLSYTHSLVPVFCDVDGFWQDFLMNADGKIWKGNKKSGFIR